jgi:hypothetical protein
MNRTHQVWMTLPPGEVPGRGERIAQVAAKRGLKPRVAITLRDPDSVIPLNTAPTLAEAYASFDGGAVAENLGWLALIDEPVGGEASAHVCSVTFGERRGLVLRFMDKEFEDLDAELSRGVLELIAALREACGAREVVWARDRDLASIIEILDRDPDELAIDALGGVMAVAAVSEGIFSRMQSRGGEMWAGGLRFAAVPWVDP